MQKLRNQVFYRETKLTADDALQQVGPEMDQIAWMYMSDPSLVFDHDGTVVRGNQVLGNALNRSPDSLVGKNLTQIFGDNPGAELKISWLLEMLHQAGFVDGFEFAVSVPGLAVLTFEGSANQIHMNGERLYVMTLRDVSQRSQREHFMNQAYDELEHRLATQTSTLADKIEALAQANEELQELDQTRSELISLVSHQIRAPLTNMLGAVEGMQNSCTSETDECDQLLTVLRDQATRIDRLLRDVLSVARFESGDLALQIEPLSIMPILEQGVDLAFGSQERDCQLPYAPVLPLVMADKDRLIDVIINLLDNADKYSPYGTQVEIEVRPTDTEIIISVLDSGPGLTEYDTKRVFEKYYRAEAGDSQTAYGYGLGLYICRRLIEAQNGHIWAENRSSGGSRFSFSLPVS